MAKTPAASRNSDARNDPVGPMIDRLAATQQETIDRIAEDADDADDAQHSVRAVAAGAAVAANRAQDRLVEAAGENLRKARSYIERNPLATVGIAFAAGVLFSTWVRR